MKLNSKKFKISNLFIILILAIIVLLGLSGFAEIILSQSILQHFNQAKADYEAAQESFSEAKQNFYESLEIYLQNKNNVNLLNLQEDGREYLLEAIELMTKQLEFISATIDTKTTLTATQKTFFKDQIASEMLILNDLSSEVENAETTTDLMDAAKDVKQEWIELNAKLKKNAGIMQTFGLANVMEEIHSIEKNINDLINSEKSEGKDTTELEDLFSDLKNNIALAEENNQKAKEKFDSITGVEDLDIYFGDGYTYVDEAKKNIKAAYNDLKQIILKSKEDGFDSLSEKLQESLKDFEDLGNEYFNINQQELISAETPQLESDGFS